MVEALRKAKLRIADQKAIINQIAGTYKSFSRAAMEYIDNAIDVAYIEIEETGVEKIYTISITIDKDNKEITFFDEGRGMDPENLCGLIEKIGLSDKKSVPWANGQFGFGIHAFRAFCKTAKFTSAVVGGLESTITVDRDTGEDEDVECLPSSELEDDGIERGTSVTLSKFNRGVFKEKYIFDSIKREILDHFDDVLRSGKIKIIMRELWDEEVTRKEEVIPFNYDIIRGEEYKEKMIINGKEVLTQLKITEDPIPGMDIVITNNGRRIAILHEMTSYVRHVKQAKRNVNTWKSPYLIGFIELNGAISPNITRDDLQPGHDMETFYDWLLEKEKEIKDKIESNLKKRNDETYDTLGDLMSNYLESFLRKYKFDFGATDDIDQTGAGYGGDEPGGGGPGPDESSGGDKPGPGKGGAGTSSTGKGSEERGPRKRRAPAIKFIPLGIDKDRVVNAVEVLQVNTDHADFNERLESPGGEHVVSERLLNYISIVLAPHIIQMQYEKEGLMPTSPLESGNRSSDFIMQFEAFLIKNANEIAREIF